MPEKLTGLTEWFQTPPGQYLLGWEQTQFDLAVADLRHLTPEQRRRAIAQFRAIDPRLAERLIDALAGHGAILEHGHERHDQRHQQATAPHGAGDLVKAHLQAGGQDDQEDGQRRNAGERRARRHQTQHRRPEQDAGQHLAHDGRLAPARKQVAQHAGQDDQDK